MQLRLPVFIWLLGLSIIAIYFNQIFLYSFDISSDDALYFQRAIHHFSVLEFSPHFPGYPGFVLLERIVYYLTQSSVSNIIVSMSAALLLCIFIFIYCYQLLRNKVFTLFAIIIFLQQGSLAELALNGLSDGAALVFFACYLLLQGRSRSKHSPYNASPHHKPIGIKPWYFLSGILLALCLATRPSYVPLIAVVLLSELILYRNWSRLYYQIMAITFIGIVCAGYIFMQDGWAYFAEAQRFTQGHFQIWGNTADQNQSNLQQWYLALTRYYSPMSLGVFACALCFGIFKQSTRYLTILAWSWFIWILSGQNPENIRHIAVLSLLTPIIFILLFDQFYQPLTQYKYTKFYKCLCFVAFIPFISLSSYKAMQSLQTQIHSPNKQAINYFKQFHIQQVIISNYNLSTLREGLPQHLILDNYYQGSTPYLAKTKVKASDDIQGYWQISSTPIEAPLTAQFTGRFTGERSLYLYYFLTDEP